MSKLKPSVRFCAIIMIVLLQATILFSGETGKIAGKVTDKQTGEPLPGANIIINTVWVGDREVNLDRPMGASSDAEGEYFVINIPPGTYTVSVSYMGFNQEKRTKVFVGIDKTTRLNFQLTPLAIAGQEVVVTAYRPDKVESELTATKLTYDVDVIQSIAGVEDITDILELQADVVDDHFRGGRVGEALYLIDGSAIVNPLNNQRAFRPIVTGLEQVDVYTSGFSAEYGNAQSGVINMVPKEGYDSWNTRVEVSGTAPYYKSWGGSVYSFDNLYFYDLLKDSEEWLKDNPNNPGNPLWEVGFGSANYIAPPTDPEAPAWTYEDTLAMANLARINWLQALRDVGMEYDNTVDYRLDFTIGGPISKDTRLFIAARQNVMTPVVPTPYNDTERQIMGNITHQLNENNKLKLLFTYDYQFYNIFSGSFLRWVFDRTLPITKSISTTKQYGLEWQHVFNPKTFMDWSFKVLDVGTKDRIELLLDGQFTEDYGIRRNVKSYGAPGGYSVGNINNDRGNERTTSYELKSSVTSQINKNNLVKAGLQLNYYEVDVNMEMDVSNEGDFRAVNFTKYPFEGALYVQDKMEFEGLIANLGLRMDFYDLNTEYYTDEFSPLRNPNYDPTKPYKDRGQYYDKEAALTEDTEIFTRLQPRVGISFPVSDVSVFHLNYGSFTQRPSFSQLLYSQVTIFDEIEVIGNPRLKPETTQAYDVGLVQGLPFGLYLDVSAYYKDVKNLVESAYYFDEQQSVYRTYRNRDYANIKGFHVNLEKNFGAIQGYMRYNYEAAKGKSSNDLNAPITFFENPAEGQDPVELPDPEDIYLDYDRTHKVVFNLRFLSPSDFGPEVWGIKPFANFSLSNTLRFMTGRPYTWDDKGLGLKFNKRTPDEYDLRIRLERRIKVAENKLTLYAEAFNVLNEKTYNYGRVFNNDYNLVKWEKDRENVNVYDEYEPYVTSQDIYILRNEPRHYRFGIIYNF